MGASLSGLLQHPLTSQYLTRRESSWVRTGSCETQGYRAQMEDGIIAELALVPSSQNSVDPILDRRRRFPIRSKYVIHDETKLGAAAKIQAQAEAHSFGLLGIFDGHGGRVCSSFFRVMLPREIAGLGNAMDPGQLACAVMKLDRMFRAAEPETSQCEGSTALFAVFRPLRASDPRPSAEVHEFPVDQVLLELLPEEHRRKKRANQQPQQPQVEKQGEALAGSRSNSRRRSISAAMNSPGVGANKEAIKDGTEGDAVGANGPPKPDDPSGRRLDPQQAPFQPINAQPRAQSGAAPLNQQQQPQQVKAEQFHQRQQPKQAQAQLSKSRSPSQVQEPQQRPQQQEQPAVKASSCAAPRKKRRYLVVVGNVGDSRAILVRRNGSFSQLSRDHTTSLPQELRRITNAGGYVSENRVNGELAMSRAVGDWQFKSNLQHTQEDQILVAVPEFLTLIAQEGDLLALFCDGITERLPTAQIAGLLHHLVYEAEGISLIEPFDPEQPQPTSTPGFRSKADLARVAGLVCDAALARGSTDNMSMVLAQFQGHFQPELAARCWPGFKPLPSRPGQDDEGLYPVRFVEVIPPQTGGQLQGQAAHDGHQQQPDVIGEQYIPGPQHKRDRGHQKAWRADQNQSEQRLARYRQLLQREALDLRSRRRSISSAAVEGPAPHPGAVPK